jgi:hypothetical protein
MAKTITFDDFPCVSIKIIGYSSCLTKSPPLMRQNINLKIRMIRIRFKSIMLLNDDLNNVVGIYGFLQRIFSNDVIFVLQKPPSFCSNKFNLTTIGKPPT